MKHLVKNIYESINRDQRMWALVEDIDLGDLLKRYKHNSEVIDAITIILKLKLSKNELTIDELEDIASNIRGKATELMDRSYGVWDGGDDLCYDISCASVGLGQKNYERCLKDKKYCKSMENKTRGFENYLYAFNDVLDK